MRPRHSCASRYCSSASAIALFTAALAVCAVGGGSGSSDIPQPQKLSEYGLFTGDGSKQQPVAGVVPYDLNTPLFSDYTEKLRFVRLPMGQSAQYHPDNVFEFPVGTVIAKTFAYP